MNESERRTHHLGLPALDELGSSLHRAARRDIESRQPESTPVLQAVAALAVGAALGYGLLRLVRRKGES